MSAPRDAATRVRNDWLKLLCLILVIGGVGAVFFVTPSLSTPTLLSIVLSLLLSPAVAALERRGLSRGQAIGAVFGLIGLFSAVSGLWAAQTILNEWHGFSEKAPHLFEATLARLQALELEWKARYPVLSSVHLADTLTAWGASTGQWFIAHGPAIMGQLATCLLVVPLLTFALLNDGRAVRKRVFEIIPNRFFEPSFLIFSRILGSLSDYLRAKLFEALLVGLLTTAGLIAIRAPYAWVLGIIAGVTNIIPYLGPVVGAAPGFVIAAFDPSGATPIWQYAAVYGFANLIDTVVIFPVVVAKLVNLHPIILVVLVMIGGEYYGLVGMLISIPIATGIKIVFQEIYAAVYHSGPSHARISG